VFVVEAPSRDDIPGRTSAATSGGSRARQLVAAGGSVVAVGIALVGTAHPDIGGPVLLVGWLLLAGGIHRFGRSD
jgi:hypothetical protein